jgi:hypothetical protein
MKPLPGTYTTPPMPGVREAQLHLRDAKLALERPMWNREQVEDVLRSVEHFMTAARASLHSLRKD